MSHVRFALLGSVALLGMAMFAPGLDPVSAQSGAQPIDLPCADNASVTPLGQAMPDGASGQALAALRVEIAPAGSLGMHTHPGTLIVTVESGDFAFTMAEAMPDDGMAAAGEMQIMRAERDSTPAAAEPVQAGTEYVLQSGDWLVESPGMAHSVRALGEEPAVVLVTGLVAPDKPLIQCLDEEPAS